MMIITRTKNKNETYLTTYTHPTHTILPINIYIEMRNEKEEKNA